MRDYSSCWTSYFGDTVGGFIEKWAREMPDREVLVSKDMRLTWKELHHMTDKIAAGFLKLGLRKGNRLALLGSNDVIAILAWLAAAKIGVIPIAINPRYRRQEIEYILKDSGASAVVTRDHYEGFSLIDLILEIRNLVPHLHHIVVYPGEDVASGVISMEVLLGEIEVDKAFVYSNTPKPTDILFLLYTSGTTGIPKGVIHTHDTMLSCGKILMEEVWHLNEEEVILLAMPFAHMIGHEMLINVSLIVGAKVVLLESFDPVEFVKTLERERATLFCGVPTMFLLPILRVPDLKKKKLDPFKWGITCGFYAPPEQMKMIKESYGLEWLYQLLGSTEAGLMATTRKEDKEDVAFNSLGRPVSTVTIKVIDEQGKELPPGEIGEICYKSPHLCTGYWNKPDKTAEDFDKDGFWHSGDMGCKMDEEGNIRLVGRKKEIIKRGGFNIHPGEIENLLLNYPKILATVVVGYPDEILGEKICIFVEPKSGKEIDGKEIIKLCKENLADYKAPDMVRIEASLPRLPNGKVDKVLLRDNLLNERRLKRIFNPSKG